MIIGVVEGLTEFLPVSSTAHIRLTQGDLLGIPAEDEYWKMFSIVIQLGAILSVLVYFWRRILMFMKSFPGGQSGDRTWWNHPISLVLLSFVVTAIPCLLLDKTIGEMLENKAAIGIALIVGGVVMWVVDRRYTSIATTKSIEEITMLQAIIIGLAQIFAAAFPGVSRSMSTIAGGQIMGLSREVALEFSFFLSIPVMVAATCFKLLQFVLESPVAMTSKQMVVLAIGFGVSFIVALVVIAWFMDWVKKHGFAPFAIYRIILGAFVLASVYGMLG